MIIGIVGKVGAGKSDCTKYLEEHYNAIVFSCDNIAKEMIEKGEVDYQIGNSYEFFTNEELQNECREKVHPKVFLKIIENINNYENKNNVSNESHKTTNINNIFEQIRQKKLNIIKTSSLYVVETALPSEILYNICDNVICIENSYDMKQKLLKEHRNYTDSQVKLIYDSQKYYEKYYDMADYKIKNNGTKEELLNKLKEVIDEICIICK